MSTEKSNSPEILSGNALENFFSNPDSTVETEVVEEITDENLTSFFDSKTEDFVPAEKEPTPTPKETVVETPKNNFYSDLVKEYLEEGEWKDLELVLKEGEEPVALSDLKDITPEVFRQVRAAQKQMKEEEINSDYISVKGLDETKKKMIELAKAGGDVRELVQVETDFVHPLKDLNLDDEKVQEAIVRQKLATQMPAKYIEAEIKDLKDNLLLDVEAKKVVDEVNTNFDKLVETKKSEQLAQIQSIKDEQKEFRKKMTETFRSLELKDTLVKDLTDKTSKFDENGIAEVDKMYFQAKENPEFFAKVAFLLSDEKAFNEFQGVKIKNNVTKEAIKTILKITPKTSTNSAVTPAKKGDEIEQFFQQT